MDGLLQGGDLVLFFNEQLLQALRVVHYEFCYYGSDRGVAECVPVGIAPQVPDGACLIWG